MKIEEYAKFIIRKMGVKIKVNFDKRNLDGTPRKILNSKIARRYGWRPKYSLDRGFKLTFADYLLRLKKLKIKS